MSAVARLRRDLGIAGMAALAVLTLTAAFHLRAIQPLELRLQRLDGELRRLDARAGADGFKRVRAGDEPDRVEAFYRFFERPESVDYWLAKLYGIATASGLALRSGDYRLSQSRQRIERYEITLPVDGTYTQVRAFLEAALAEIPVLSLDQATFRRKAASEGRVEADIVLTLHMLRK